MKFILPFLGGLLTVCVIILGIQFGFSFLMTDSNTPIVAQKQGSSQAETTQIVEGVFKEHFLEVPSMGTNALQYQSTYSTQTTILDKLRENNIEVYVLTKANNTSTSWRIYNKNGLQYNIQWINTLDQPSLTLTPIIKDTNSFTMHTVDTTRKYPVAIVISGSKYKNLRPLINLTTPLNFALEPTSPFGLRNAVEAARNWHEVLLDIRFASQFELDNIPFTSALLSDHGMPNTHLQVINTNDIQQVQLSNFSEFTGDASNRIWLINVAEHSISEVADWVGSLPKHIQLVRLSHWDISPTQ